MPNASDRSAENCHHRDYIRWFIEMLDWNMGCIFYWLFCCLSFVAKQAHNLICQSWMLSELTSLNPEISDIVRTWGMLVAHQMEATHLLPYIWDVSLFLVAQYLQYQWRPGCAGQSNRQQFSQFSRLTRFFFHWTFQDVLASLFFGLGGHTKLGKEYFPWLIYHIWNMTSASQLGPAKHCMVVCHASLWEQLHLWDPILPLYGQVSIVQLGLR